MPKPDPTLLDTTRYPYSCTIEPRFGDLDVNMHINNVAMAGILEDGRVRFNRATEYRDSLAELIVMVASIQIEYLGQGHYPDPITVHSALECTGRTSMGLVQLMTQGERIIAFARSVLVTVDRAGRPAPLPQHFTEGMVQWSLRP